MSNRGLCHSGGQSAGRQAGPGRHIGDDVNRCPEKARRADRVTLLYLTMGAEAKRNRPWLLAISKSLSGLRMLFLVTACHRLVE